MDIPNLQDYKKTGDLGEMYFQGVLLRYTDAKKRQRYGLVVKVSNKRICYRPLRLDGGGISNREYELPLDRFSIIPPVEPRFYRYNGVIHWGGVVGHRSHKKSISLEAMSTGTIITGQERMPYGHMHEFLASADVPSVDLKPVNGSYFKALSDLIENGDHDEVLLTSGLACMLSRDGESVKGLYKGLRVELTKADFNKHMKEYYDVD